MNPKARVAHVVNGKVADQRPTYYGLFKFAVQKEAKINFNVAKKTRDLTSKPKATTHFYFNHQKSGLPASPAVWMVAPAPQEGSGDGEATPFQVRTVTAASPMRPYRKTCPSPMAMWRLLSEWSRHLKHLQGDASGVTRWDIDSVMRNVKCLTLNF